MKPVECNATSDNDGFVCPWCGTHADAEESFAFIDHHHTERQTWDCVSCRKSYEVFIQFTFCAVKTDASTPAPHAPDVSQKTGNYDNHD